MEKIICSCLIFAAVFGMTPAFAADAPAAAVTTQATTDTTGTDAPSLDYDSD